MDHTNSITRLKSQLAQNGLATSLRQRQADALARRQAAGTRVLLLDTSGSMSESSRSGVSRIDALWDIVQQLRAEHLDFLTCTFNTHPTWSDMTQCPHPSGDTRLLDALQYVSDTPNLVSITLVHDGEPSHMSECLTYADSLRIPINVLFVGNEHDSYAMNFARELASVTNGSFASHDINVNEMKALAACNDARLMLSA